MNAPADSRNPEPPPSPGPRPPQFTLRAALLFITACCVLFAGFAASPGRTLGFLAVAVLLAGAASAFGYERRRMTWLIAGAALGLAAGLSLGAALIHSAYGPADRACAWEGLWTFSYAGLLAGGLSGLGLANTRPVAIAVWIGGLVPVLGAVVVILLTGPREIQSYAVREIWHGVGWLVVLGGSLGMAAGSYCDRSATHLRVLGLLLLLGAILAPCLLSSPVVR